MLKSDRPARCAVTLKNTNLADLLVVKAWVDKWKFVGARAQSAISCHWGLQTSICNIHALCHELLHEEFKLVCTTRLNQDCVENFFAGLHSKQGWNENPTPLHFTAAFRNAVVLSRLDSTSAGKNCIADDDFKLVQHSTIESAVQSNVDMQPSRSSSHFPPSSTVSDDTMWEEISNEILNCDVCYETGVLEVFTEAEESFVSYLSGRLAHKCGICLECQMVLCKRLDDHSYCRRPIDDFASVKWFVGSASVGLVEPCNELFAAVHIMEQFFRIHYQNMSKQPPVATALFEVIQPHCEFQFLFVRHAEHSNYLAEKLTKMYIVMRIFYAVKFENMKLAKPTASSHGEIDQCLKEKCRKFFMCSLHALSFCWRF